MFEEQQLAFEKFTQLKVGALFMQMGTGKTKVALDIVNFNKVDLLIYVCPFSVKSNIDAEIKKWGINCDYILIGYETIQASDYKYLELLKMLENKKCFIIADESIFIKNEDTKRFNRLCELRNKCEYALILNGTPLTKNEWDLYNQMYFMSPLIINMNRSQFLETFFTKITYKKRNKKEKEFYKFSDVNSDILYKMIEPYIFSSDLIFDKEEKTIKYYIDYSGDEYYEEKEKRLNNYKKTEDKNEILLMLVNLNVIASCYNGKNDKLIDYIKNKQVIVYCNYIKEVEYITSKIECYCITGKEKNRKEIIENFRNNSIPLIMTFGVGSYSLNLQFCNEIVYSSINFNFGLMEQSKYRIKRIGQENNIKYTYFLTNLGITKIILDNLSKKQNLENLIKGEIEKWIQNL